MKVSTGAWRALERIGLTDKERAVYTGLLSLGKGTGYEITKASGLKKSTTYFTLEELRKKDLVQRLPSRGKVLFVPKHPQGVVSDQKQRAHELELALPELLALAGTDDSPRIQYFEGPNGFRNALKECRNISHGKEIRGFYGYREKLPQFKEHVDTYVEFLNMHLKSGGRIRGLTPDHESTRWFLKAFADTNQVTMKFLPLEKYPSQASIEIVDDYLMALSHSTQQHVIIKNNNITTILRSLFEMMWESN